MTIEKDAIIRKKKSYYEKIIKTVDYSVDPEEGHYLERSWIYIFSKYFNFSYYLRIYCFRFCNCEIETVISDFVSEESPHYTSWKYKNI